MYSKASFFESVFNVSPIGMALVSLTGKFLRTNDAFNNIVGYSEKELLDMDFQQLTYPDDLKEDLALMQKCINGEIGNYQMEKRYFTKNGKIIWILLFASIIIEKGFPPVFTAQVQDITEMKMYKERTATALENGGIGVWTWYAKNDLLIWNKTMFDLYEIEEKDFIPKYIFFNNIVHKDDREDVDKKVRESIIDDKDFLTRFRIVLKDGTVRWIEGRGKVNVDSLGNIAMMSGINMDITDQVLAETQLETVSEILAQKLAKDKNENS